MKANSSLEKISCSEAVSGKGNEIVAKFHGLGQSLGMQTKIYFKKEQQKLMQLLHIY